MRGLVKGKAGDGGSTEEVRAGEGGRGAAAGEVDTSWGRQRRRSIPGEGWLRESGGRGGIGGGDAGGSGWRLSERCIDDVDVKLQCEGMIRILDYKTKISRLCVPSRAFSRL